MPTVKLKKGSPATVTLHAVLPPGFHANSSTPTDAYLIPLSLKWTGGPLQSDGIVYPKAAMEKYSFSDKPLSVVTGDFAITAKFKVPGGCAVRPAAQKRRTALPCMQRSHVLPAENGERQLIFEYRINSGA